jgi:hypothetical protein
VDRTLILLSEVIKMLNRSISSFDVVIGQMAFKRPVVCVYLYTRLLKFPMYTMSILQVGPDFPRLAGQGECFNYNP